MEVGIVDTRNVIKLIQERYNCDFSDYALTAFKHRLEYVLSLRSIKHIDIMINKLSTDQPFFDQFLDDISVPSTEMFRDPSLWRYLKDELIPSLYAENSNFKIWLPGAVSGDELFSLCILLKEIGLLGKVQVMVSCLSEKSIDYIKSGAIKASKIELSEENYTRANFKDSFSNYCKEIKPGIFIRDTSLIADVTFSKQDIELSGGQNGVKLVLYRNKMIYFNPTLQIKILKQLYNCLLTNGYLIVGIKEFLANLYNVNDFLLVHPHESIYKKR